MNESPNAEWVSHAEEDLDFDVEVHRPMRVAVIRAYLADVYRADGYTIEHIDASPYLRLALKPLEDNDGKD